MTDPTRRTVLVAGALGLGLGLVGCTTADIPVIGRRDPDLEQRLETATSEQSLIALYAAAITALPSLASELSAIQAQHTAHLKAVTSGLDGDMPSPAPVPSVGDRKQTLAQLRKAEKDAAKARTSTSVATEDPEVAELIARIGTSESAHAAYLTGGLK